MRLVKIGISIASAIAVMVLSGCAYYQVTDPASGRTYFTNNWMAGRYTWNGAVQFHDQKSGQNVTLQSSEVKEITKAEYEDAVGMTPTR